jgi:hypothetical protein
MYNTDRPTRAELPSTKQLLLSTIIAATTAAIILITVILPAEYAIDPTGIGRLLQLTQMGETKAKLSKVPVSDSAALIQPVNILSQNPTSSPLDVNTTWRHETRLKLAPNQSVEVKLKMLKDAKANYEWLTEQGTVNFDEHGDGGSGAFISYKKGRGESSSSGELIAAFDGVHGWYWKNPGESEVTIILRTRGDYIDIKKMQ